MRRKSKREKKTRRGWRGVGERGSMRVERVRRSRKDRHGDREMSKYAGGWMNLFGKPLQMRYALRIGHKAPSQRTSGSRMCHRLGIERVSVISVAPMMALVKEESVEHVKTPEQVIEFDPKGPISPPFGKLIDTQILLHMLEFVPQRGFWLFV